ncbi:MAG: hypothetical protein Q4E71_07890, partial [Prevotella sp.]|nr:hypothetical protein [Prevotella sp.]
FLNSSRILRHLSELFRVFNSRLSTQGRQGAKTIHPYCVVLQHLRQHGGIVFAPLRLCVEENNSVCDISAGGGPEKLLRHKTGINKSPVKP